MRARGMQKSDPNAHVHRELRALGHELVTVCDAVKMESQVRESSRDKHAAFCVCK
jgi:hypothetical protein